MCLNGDYMEIELWQLNNIVKAAAKEAVDEYRYMENPTSDEISEKKAYEEFGEGWVDHQKAIGAAKWKRKGVHKNSPKLYSRRQLRELKYGPNILLKAVAYKNEKQ